MLPPALLPPFFASYRGRLLAAFSTFGFCASGGALEAVPSFFALSALYAFRFSASGRASGSVFRVLRVIRVPIFCFRLCFWKRFPCSPRSPPYRVLLSFRAFS